MEFRLILPLLPPLFWIFLWIAREHALSPPLWRVLATWILLGNLHHTLLFERWMPREGIDSVSQLHSYVNETDVNWALIGKVLEEYFPEQNVSIAVSAAGAIPYYSRLPTVDILGLNDAWIARHGENWGTRPGHSKHATLDYLKQKNVHLLIGNPWIKPVDRVVRYSFKTVLQFVDIRIEFLKELPTSARILEIPVASGYVCVVLYLYPHPKIDQIIRQHAWKQYSIFP